MSQQNSCKALIWVHEMHGRINVTGYEKIDHLQFFINVEFLS